ncbi:MAG: hypothetical protein Q6L60_10730, partial [Thermostichus sp. HHBFW_bins_43]
MSVLTLKELLNLCEHVGVDLELKDASFTPVGYYRGSEEGQKTPAPDWKIHLVERSKRGSLSPADKTLSALLDLEGERHPRLNREMRVGNCR